MLQKSTKKKIVFELTDKTHTFCNMLKDELQNDKNVSVATYTINHPLVGKPVFTLEIESGDIKKILDNAINRLQKKISDLEKESKKAKSQSMDYGLGKKKNQRTWDM